MVKVYGGAVETMHDIATMAAPEVDRVLQVS